MFYVLKFGRKYILNFDVFCTQFFISTFFGAFYEKTTKAFICLKSEVIHVFELPNVAVKAFYVVIFICKGLCAYFWTLNTIYG